MHSISARFTVHLIKNEIIASPKSIEKACCHFCSVQYSVCQSVILSVCQLVSQSIVQSVSWSVDHSVSQLVVQSVSKSVGKSVSWSVSLPLFFSTKLYLFLGKQTGRRDVSIFPLQSVNNETAYRVFHLKNCNFKWLQDKMVHF